MLAARVLCSAGKGFGGAAQPKKAAGKGGKKAAGVSSGDSKAVQRAVKLLEDKEAQQQQRQRGPPSARPVDPREAARGKVEYVRVKDWGSGKPEDLGQLQVDADATRTFTAGGEQGGGMPFHEALARRLEMLQKQGALGIAQPKGGKPLPPFERWAFAEGHYVQFLSDMGAVHAALEGSIAQAAAQQQQQQAAAAAEAPQMLQALQLFGPEQGLDRAAALQQDMDRIAGRSQQPGGEQQAAQQAQQPPAPTQHAAAYAAYIASLGRLCGAAEGPDEAEQVVLRLLANAYMVHLMHLTGGGRVAKTAADRLGLEELGALAFHRDYPGLPADAKPLERFVGNTNALGRLLSEEQQERLMEELAKAMTKTSMLLVPLAQEA